MKRIARFEPWFFLFFGAFHLHRIWGLIDREGYAGFWMGTMERKGSFYYGLMGILAALCALGIYTFVKNRRQNGWWRWLYLFGGGYVLFDLAAISLGFPFWSALLRAMFNPASPYWNFLWSAFILMGGLSFGLGLYLWKKRGEALLAEKEKGD